jgi:hypothetical protein
MWLTESWLLLAPDHLLYRSSSAGTRTSCAPTTTPTVSDGTPGRPASSNALPPPPPLLAWVRASVVTQAGKQAGRAEWAGHDAVLSAMRAMHACVCLQATTRSSLSWTRMVT